MAMPSRLKRAGFTAGAAWVTLLTIATLGATVLVTICYWEFLDGKTESPTAVFRNMGFLAGGIVALVFAFWRGLIAKQQEVVAEERAATARLEHLHGRFERAVELVAKEGIANAHARISGMHVLRHLVRDAPEEFADEVVEIVAAFMLQPHLDPERNELREFTVAALTAKDVYDVVKGNLLFDKQYRQRMRRAVEFAAKQLKENLQSANIDPEELGI